MVHPFTSLNNAPHSIPGLMQNDCLIQPSGDLILTQGAREVVANEPVNLVYTQGTPPQWIHWRMDEAKGQIFLHDDLLLDVAGNSPLGMPRILVSRFVAGRPSQRWAWSQDGSGMIVNLGYPGYCLDFGDAPLFAGRGVMLAPIQPGRAGQQWRITHAAQRAGDGLTLRL